MLLTKLYDQHVALKMNQSSMLKVALKKEEINLNI